MQYTLWSRDRLLGETDLGFLFREHGFRCGWFHPTALGERFMPFATGVGPALNADFMIGPDATTRADLLSAVDYEAALELQLRGPDGAVIGTESIDIVDTHHLLSLGECELRESAPLTPEEEAEIDSLVEEWSAANESSFEPPSDGPTELPRDQIQIRLLDPSSVF